MAVTNIPRRADSQISLLTCVIICGLALVLVVFRKGARELTELVRAFYVGEAAKFGVTIVLFVVGLATMKGVLVPGALFGAFVAAFVVHWVVLPGAMRRLESGQNRDKSR